MSPAEFQRWIAWAHPDAVNAVLRQTGLARIKWVRRLGMPLERADLPRSTRGKVCTVKAVGAAAQVTAEMLAICHIWPDGPASVLRPEKPSPHAGRRRDETKA